MIPTLAQVDAGSFWNAPNGSAKLWIGIVVAFIAGLALLFGLMQAPTNLRRPIVAGVTFLSGLFYVLYWIYPKPINRAPNDAPRNVLEAVSFWIKDAQPRVADFTNIIAGTLIGLGIYSLLRIHLRRLLKAQKDWGYSAVLLGGLVLMTVFGYWDWIQRQSPAGGQLPYIAGPGWGVAQYGRDLLFDGLLQNMDAAMFSVIAFYILSAAYRAFRARSIEATILLITALIVLLSLMGLVEFYWNKAVVGTLTGGDPQSVANNLKLSSVAKWLKDNIQTPSIRGIDFGVGVGLLAMALRLWLSLEKMGGERA